MPAPMPMVGTLSASVTRRATAAGIASISTIAAPAASRARASAMSRSAPSSDLPCTRYPPSVCTDCGVSPMCAQTGMPRSTMNRVVSTMGAPPSILTMPAPAAISRTAFVNACEGDPWNDPKGRSASTRACELPRATHLTWYSVCSTVTGSVESCPWITMPRESPTSRISTPAASESAAKLAS